ncbi:MAG: AAA family ATPase [Pseudomonadales bacterium]
MLLEFGANNFYSFEEGFEASFRLNKHCPEDVSQGRETSTVMCVKGANGSGKTNVLRVLGFLRIFCCDSFAEEPEEELDILSFFSSKSPSEFYIEFSIGGNEYRYELTASYEKVYREDLFQDKTLVVARDGNKFTKINGKFSALKGINLRNNASFISTANKYEIDEIEDIYTCFKSLYPDIEKTGEMRSMRYQYASDFYKQESSLFDAVKDIMKRLDLGIDDISIVKQKDEDEDSEAMYNTVFFHKTSKGGKKLAYDLASSGTKTLYEALCAFLVNLKYGHILVVDEFGINFHPHALPLLVNLYTNKKTNPSNAQLIFTTHDTAIMDTLGKYRTLMVMKENNASFAYRLDEVPGDMLRDDRKISPLYDANKIGGAPIIT